MERKIIIAIIVIVLAFACISYLILSDLDNVCPYDRCIKAKQDGYCYCHHQDGSSNTLTYVEAEKSGWGYG